MTVASCSNLLAANLSALAQRNAALHAALSSADPAATIRFEQTPQGVPSAVYDGKRLASAHRPLDEAKRLIDPIDIVEHAVFVIYGFGLGYHVQQLAQRIKRGGLILVFEPDLALLRAVFENVDHASWLREAPVLFITDPLDRAALATRLAGAEAIIAQGVEFIVHPPSEARLADSSRLFAATLEEFVRTAKVTLLTTLVRSIDTIRNLLLNIDHYGVGEGIEPLRNIAAGRPAVIVSAGPSLSRNIHQLARPGVRDRCVIIAVQTTLKPLLAAGITPHFVTALDYHEISSRFYEDLDADALREVTLVAEPKVNPVVLDVYPGPVRCCASAFLDQLLGEHARPMGTLKAGATVAHLALYLARHLGCDPVALVGQDLGFTDGLYYAPGTAIHNVWATELNPFNTIEMMEWQRIVRHRVHLKKFTDQHGRPIYSDMQMITYRQQFERDFAADRDAGLTVIDATEGGVPKQHTTSATLEQFLGEHADQLLPSFPLPGSTVNEQRCAAVRTHVEQVRRDVASLQQASRETAGVLRQMLEHLDDAPRLNRLFAQVDRYRLIVDEKKHAFDLLEHLNQLGAYKRQRADRKIRMRGTLPQRELQQAQIERDLDNVSWIADAAGELIDQLAQAERVLRAENRGTAASRRNVASAAASAIGSDERPRVQERAARISALVPIDLERSALGIPRSLGELFLGRTVLQATLEQLARIPSLDSIILIAPHHADIEPLFNRAKLDKPVEIERCEGSPFGPECLAVAAARLIAPTCWRAGIAGMSIYDEALCPTLMHDIMQRRALTAALIAAPDWPLLDPSSDTGAEAIIQRHLEQPDKLNLVFSQAPPGLSPCLVSASLMAELAQRNRLSTIGGLLIYQPHAPQPDPIARDANIQINHTVRNALCRATFDSKRSRSLLVRALDSPGDPAVHTALSSQASLPTLLHRIEQLEREDLTLPPQHVILELTPERSGTGLASPRTHSAIDRPSISTSLARHIIDQAASIEDAVLAFAGAGDPLLHPDGEALLQHARRAGVRAVHVRTTLQCEQNTLDALLAAGVDVVSVELHADRAATFELMHGENRFEQVLRNIEYLVEHRNRLTNHAAAAAMALPWIVPIMQRRRETLGDIDTFFDRWMHILGCAVIEGPPMHDPASTGRDGHLIPVVQPAHVVRREQCTTMHILSDGSVPITPNDLIGARAATRLSEDAYDLMSAWRTLRLLRLAEIDHAS